MKIVQLCPYAMDRPGGVQRHVHDLSVWLVKQGHQVRIVAPPSPGRSARQDGMLQELGHARNLAVHGTAFEISMAGPMALRRQVRALRDWGAELVHLHTPWTPMLVGQLWRRLALPSVTTIHATLPEAAGTGLIDRYIRRAARYFLTRSDAVIVPSPAPLPMLHRLIPGLATTTLPPAIDLESWRSMPSRRAGRTLSLVFLGRLEERKGINILLEAWKMAAGRLPDATLTVAGDGELRAMVQSARGPRLRYVGRPDDDTAQDLLSTADVFLAPAPYGESYGLVLAEAMAAGAIPIAAANPGYSAVLGSEVPQLMVPPGDASALAETIVTLAGDREMRDSLRPWVKARAMEADITGAGPGYEAVYETVLAGETDKPQAFSPAR